MILSWLAAGSYLM